MLTDEQIAEEAKERLKYMDPELRAAFEKQINEWIDIHEIAAKKNYNLSREELNRYHRAGALDVRYSAPGGINNPEDYLMNKLHVSREELANMKKNPFSAGLITQLILAVLLVLGIVATAGISKATGINTSILYPVFSILSGLFAMGFANELLNAIRFRNLQRKYESKKYQEEEINAAAYRLLVEEVKERRAKGEQIQQLMGVLQTQAQTADKTG